jgi:penicillin-binding protein 1A
VADNDTQDDIISPRADKRNADAAAEVKARRPRKMEITEEDDEQEFALLPALRSLTKNPFFAALATAGNIILAVALLGLLAGWIIFYHYSQDLPGFGKLTSYEPPVVTRLYAGDGKLLAEYAVQRRNYVPLTAIPKRVQQAFLSAEDKNFYSHPGVDFTGVARAVLTNVMQIGGSPVGGSTITQQVVKNFLLTNEKTIERKIKEAILAFRITQSFSKSRILELYLNEIYLGAGSYGVAAAALNYFNKSVDELTIEEAALLAALPKAPSTYDPRKNMKAAQIRRDWVISRMEEDGYIDAQEAETARTSPITLGHRPADEIAKADFFAEEVRRQIQQRYGDDGLYKGGLYVKTTLQPTLQRYADEALRKALTAYDRRHGWRGPIRRITDTDNWHAALRSLPPEGIRPLEDQQIAVVISLSKDAANIGLEDGSTSTIPMSELKWARRQLGTSGLGPVVTSPAQVLSPGDVILVKAVKPEKGDAHYALEQEPKVNGAMVVMDAHTGQVLALSGGYAYGGTEFNRATQANRQPGSAFKPFAYLAALDAGLRPNSIIYDAPIELPQGPGLPAWRPSNYTNDYLGAATMRTGLEQSRNAMTVRMVQQIGIDRALEMSERFGVYRKAPRMYSVMLGSQETTLMALTNAYAMIANGGMKVTPSLIERIDDRHGKTVWKRDTRDCLDCTVEPNQRGKLPSLPNMPESRERIINEAVNYQLIHMMEGVVQRGTATRAKSLGRPIAGKTGTTNDSRDTWFMGFTPDLVVGTYIGFDRPRTLGRRETGGSTALPAFISFMEKAMKDVPAQPFPVPEGIRFVAVERKSGIPVPGYPVVDPYAPAASATAINMPDPAAATQPQAWDEDEGVDEAPASAEDETAAPAPAPTAVVPAPKATITPAGRVGAPPSPAPGIIMEAFRTESMPYHAPAQQPLPWLQQDGAAGQGSESPLNQGTIYQYAPDGTAYPVQQLGTTPEQQFPRPQQHPQQNYESPLLQPQQVDPAHRAPAVQWQPPAATAPVQSDQQRGWGRQSGTGGLY